MTADPINRVAPRDAVRKTVARHLQWACARMPMTIAADDEKALILAELIIRNVLGEPSSAVPQRPAA